MKKLLLIPFLCILPLAGCNLSRTTTTTFPTLTFGFAGDVMLERRILPFLETGLDPFEEVTPILRQFTVAFINLETSVSAQGVVIRGKPYVFMSAPSTLALVTNAGIDAVSIANNHTMDYGEIAMTNTLNHLDDYGILHTGAGLGLSQATTPIVIVTNGIRLGILAFGDIYPISLYSRGENDPGIAGIFSDEVMTAIKKLRPQVDFLVVSLHTGVEYDADPMPGQVTYGHRFIDSGADLVVMHHPHVIQGIERYKDGMIFYSVGNFVFDQMREPTRYSMIGSVEIVKSWDTNGDTNLSTRYFVTPVMKDLTNYRPNLPTPAELVLITNRLLSLSAKLNRKPLSFVPYNTSGYTNFLIECAN